MVLKSNRDYVFINKKGKECQAADMQSADENKILWYECKQNNIWFGKMEDGGNFEGEMKLL